MGGTASSQSSVARPSPAASRNAQKTTTSPTVHPDRPAGYRVSYVTRSGTHVSVPPTIDPYEKLGVDVGSSLQDIKSSFVRRLNTVNRTERVIASLSYYMITSKTDMFRRHGTTYRIAKPDPFVFAAVGDTVRLMAAISDDSSLLISTNEHKHTVLYLAARSGYYDTTLALIKAGASVNHQQVDGSTPLHGASFYGQREIVEMLLEYGADPKIKNRFGNTPAEEADERIKEVFEKFTTDNIMKIVVPLISHGDAHRVEKIEHKGQVVAKQVHRKIDAMTWTTIKDWKVGWHGTKSAHLTSIFTHGLKPSGTILPNGDRIEPPLGHVPLGVSCGEIKDWAQAIFVSPSVLYSSHGIYAEEIISEHKRWCVVVMTRVKPGCYTAHPPTVTHMFAKDEPQDSEYRVPVSSSEQMEDLIMRVAVSNNIVVTSCLFISMSFLEDFRGDDSNMSYEDLQSLFLSK